MKLCCVGMTVVDPEACVAAMCLRVKRVRCAWSNLRVQTWGAMTHIN